MNFIKATTSQLVASITDWTFISNDILMELTNIVKLNKNFQSAPVRASAQKELPKQAIKDCRLIVYQRDFKPVKPCLRVSCVITHGLIDRLAENFVEVTTSESVTSITDWTFISDDILTKLNNILIKLNKDIDDECHSIMQLQPDQNGRSMAGLGFTFKSMTSSIP